MTLSFILVVLVVLASSIFMEIRYNRKRLKLINIIINKGKSKSRTFNKELQIFKEFSKRRVNLKSKIMCNLESAMQDLIERHDVKEKEIETLKHENQLLKETLDEVKKESKNDKTTTS